MSTRQWLFLLEGFFVNFTISFILKFLIPFNNNNTFEHHLLYIVPDVFLKTVVLLVVFIHTIVSCIWLQFLVKPQLYLFLVRSSASNYILLIIAVEVHFFISTFLHKRLWVGECLFVCFFGQSHLLIIINDWKNVM